MINHQGFIICDKDKKRKLGQFTDDGLVILCPSCGNYNLIKWHYIEQYRAVSRGYESHKLIVAESKKLDNGVIKLYNGKLII